MQGDAGGARLNEPAIIFRTTVAEQWIDYNNHMTEHAYSLVFGQAIDAFVRQHGIGRDYCERTGCTVYTLTSQINFVREAKLGVGLEVDLLMLDAADSVMHVFQTMHDPQRQLKATYEAVIAHVNQRPHPKVAPFPPNVQQAFRDLQRRQAILGRPARAGLSVGIRR
jgi:acyl-CoA thioesterase FadM